MAMIYKPKGAAGEYAKLALNLYKGCTHGCRYCYGPGVFRKKPADYFAAANPKDFGDNLVAECKALSGKECDEILLSFIGDPYQHAERHLQLTRGVVWLLARLNLPFTILTKGGTRALRDFDIMRRYPGARFGTSLTVHRPIDVMFWEPDAALFADRIAAMTAAKKMGIPTWVSLEPVIDPAQALQIIRDHNDVVDHWKVGKINHFSAIEKQVDWNRFREDVRELLDALGADYYLKKSLTDL